MRNVNATPYALAYNSLAARAMRHTSGAVNARVAWRYDWRRVRAGGGAIARATHFDTAAAACYVARQTPETLVTLEASGR